MLAFDGLVRSRLREAAGGVPVVVPRGRCRVQVHEGIVSLSWTTDSGKAGSVVLTTARLEDYLEAGSILIVDPAQMIYCR
jgi:hypothetical protein